MRLWTRRIWFLDYESSSNKEFIRVLFNFLDLYTNNFETSLTDLLCDLWWRNWVQRFEMKRLRWSVRKLYLFSKSWPFQKWILVPWATRVRNLSLISRCAICVWMLTCWNLKQFIKNAGSEVSNNDGLLFWEERFFVHCASLENFWWNSVLGF